MNLVGLPPPERKTETFQPNGTFVLARLQKPKVDIALPEGYQEKQPRVEILAVGWGRQLECGIIDETRAKPGDICLIAGEAIELQLEGHDGEKLLVFDRKQILGRVLELQEE